MPLHPEENVKKKLTKAEEKTWNEVVTHPEERKALEAKLNSLRTWIFGTLDKLKAQLLSIKHQFATSSDQELLEKSFAKLETLNKVNFGERKI